MKYELLAVGTFNDTEYLIGHENVYNLTSLETFNYTFNSDAEQKAQNIVNKREQGIIVNFDNDILYSYESTEKSYDHISQNSVENSKKSAINKNTNTIRNENELIDLEMADQGRNDFNISPLSSTQTPSEIILYITSTGTLEYLGFDEYAKCVLPNEWYASWESEALKAGAITIKTYAWYNATYPRKPATDYGAHLTDRWQNYQHYVPDSNEPSTDTAVDDVSGIFMRNSDGKVFDAQYRAGTKGEIGEAFSGQLSQWGSQYIATNYPEYDYYTILSYYYSMSDKSSGYIETGIY